MDTNLIKRLTFLIVFALLLTGISAAQATFSSRDRNEQNSSTHSNGVPASVTSQGFGGHEQNGIPASVTSPGFGNTGQNQQQTVRFVSVPTNPHVPRDHNRGGNRDRSQFRHEQQIQYYPYAVPYYPVLDPSEPSQDEQSANDRSKDDAEYKGGPTIFDRRGEGSERYNEPRATEQKRKSQQESAELATQPPTPEPVAEQPTTLLIFKDGHQLEIANYAIVGNTLFDLTPGHPRKIALADLDLDATIAQNESLGVDFHLPTSKKAN